jgi:hypothetical protein
MNAGLSPLIATIYSRAIYLYPPHFREDHGAAMVQSLCDALADPELPKSALFTTLLTDLIRSLIKENLAMLRDTFGRPALIYNALVLAGLSTVLALALYAIPQQVLRQSANDPQLELVGNLANRLEQGATPAEAVPNDNIDMDASLSAFVIAYDEQGHVLASSGQLNGRLVGPPHGVFDYVRQHGEERVTWQPQRGVRIASVVRHLHTSAGGFVLAGRNLREVEAREEQTSTMARFLWLAMLGIVAAGTFLFGWITRTPRTAAA